MATLQDAIRFAQQDPNSKFANELRRRVEVGEIDRNDFNSALQEVMAPKPSLAGGIKSAFAERTGAAATEQQRAASGEISGGQAALRTLGQGAGFVGDVAVEGVKGVARATGLAGAGQKAIGAVGSAVAPAIQPIMQKYEELKTKYPEAMKDIEAGLNLASILPIGAGAKVAGEAAVPIVKSATTAAVKGATKVTEAAGEALAKRSAKKSFTDAVEIVREKMTPKLEEAAFAEGRLGKQKLLSPAKIAPSADEIKLAESIQPLIDRGEISAKLARKNPTAVKEVVDREVSRINLGVKEMLRDPKLNQPFNKTLLTKRLNSVSAKNRLIFAGDATAEKAYKAVVSEFKKFVDTKNISGLFEARQKFDRYIRKNFPNAFKEDVLTGSASPRAQALRDVRTVANDLISELLPTNNPYKFALKQESNLLRVVENLGTKVKGISQESKAKRFLKKPAIKYGASAAVGAGGISLIQ